MKKREPVQNETPKMTRRGFIELSVGATVGTVACGPGAEPDKGTIGEATSGHSAGASVQF